MNGVRSTYMRKGYLLIALAAAVLLAASSGTAYAQTVTIDSVTLSPTTVGEGGEATATVKFTVQAGSTAVTDDEVADNDVTVGFAFDVTGLSDSPRAANAEEANFTGITDTESESQEFVRVAAIRAGNKRTYTATRTFRVNHDLDAENGQFKLGVSVDEWTDAAEVTVDATTATFTIKDDETQKYTLSIPSANRGAIQEGGATAAVTLTADPKRTVAATVPGFTIVTEPNNPALYAFADDGAFTPGAIPGPAALAAGNEGATAMLEIGTIAALTDKNRDEDTVTLKLFTGGVGAASVVTELPIIAVDANKLPPPSNITAMAKDAALNGKDVTEIVEGGDPVYLTITVDRGTAATRDETTAEDLTVDIRASAGQGGDFEVEPVRVDLPGKNTSGKSITDVDIMLTALSDEDVGTEDLVLNLVVSGGPGSPAGTSTGTFTIPIVDQTTKQIEPKSEDEAYPAIMAAMEAGAGDEGLNPGESFTVMTSDLFTVAEGYTAAYAASVEGGAASASASGDSIKINAVEAGEAKVTVTATAKMASSSFMPDQTVSNIASIVFPVVVTDKMLVVMLEMPENVMEGNIVEGMSYMIRAKANRAVMEDTEVMIMRDRAQSDADDSDFTVSSAMIMAGEDWADAELMVTEDMEPDSGTNDNMGEALVLYGMVGGEETNSLTFTIWDQAVPTLPLIGQLLLALFLMAGGARLYRRRQG